jgi:hypothetical protein
VRGLLATQVPSVAESLVVAELFFKFHSFTLECMAFLATWFVLDITLLWLVNAVQRRK